MAIEQLDIKNMKTIDGQPSKYKGSSPPRTPSALSTPANMTHRKWSENHIAVEEGQHKSPTATSSKSKPPNLNVLGDLKYLGLVFIASTISLIIFLRTVVFGPMSVDDWEALRIPVSLTSAQNLSIILTSYTEAHYFRALAGHCAVYLFLQTFAIPGTVFVNLLGGAMFGMLVGFPLCLIYNTIGSLMLFQMSHACGRRVIQSYFPTRLIEFRKMLDTHRSDLIMYMTFLRVFPFTPNWFMNVASPHLSIPAWQFAIATFIGLAPYNFLSCKAGLMLMELRSKNEIIDTTTTIQLIAVAVIGFFVLPKLKKRFTTTTTHSQ